MARRISHTSWDAGSMINKSNNKNTSLSLQSCPWGTRFVEVENMDRFARGGSQGKTTLCQRLP